MDAPRHQHWLPAAMFFGAVYLILGIVFGALANTPSTQMRFTWRLAAWLASAAAFALHIAYEHFRRNSSPPATACYASIGAALGAFALAVAANIHSLRAGSSHQRALLFALVAWPALTVVPAFVVSLALAAVLARTRQRG